jgi:hypothetical protein
MTNVYTKAVIEVTQEQWVLLYEEESKKILLEPQQASGFYTAVDVLAVADTKEELDQYIGDNGLSISIDDINIEN